MSQRRPVGLKLRTLKCRDRQVRRGGAVCCGATRTLDRVEVAAAEL
jgi:hypothetical protein